ncbi:unnamed protein product, partial [Staurois parvus]
MTSSHSHRACAAPPGMRSADLCSPSSATCQCPPVPALCSSMPSASAHQCHISVPISATYQCPSEPPFSVTQCQSVPPINASQCHLSVLPISATYQCQSVAYQSASVPPICFHQCCLSVSPNSASQCQSMPPIS